MLVAKQLAEVELSVYHPQHLCLCCCLSALALPLRPQAAQPCLHHPALGHPSASLGIAEPWFGVPLPKIADTSTLGKEVVLKLC